MFSNFAPYTDLDLIPEGMQLVVMQTFLDYLERACLSDMDGVLTKHPYQYACPVLDKRIIGPLARANRQTAKNGHPLQRLAVVSARDVQAQLAIPGMPKGIFHFGGLGTRYWHPDSRQIVYTGDPAAQTLCQQIISLLVSRLITAGRKKYSNIYWDYRVDGINLLLEELPKVRQQEVVKICQEIAAELGLKGRSPLTLEYRLGDKEPNCDFISKRMLTIGKGSAVTDFLNVFDRVGFLLMQEDTERWLKTFVQAAQTAMEQDGSSTLKGHCAVLITPSAQECNIKETGPNSWWITLSDQNILARFEDQYITLLERGAAA